MMAYMVHRRAWKWYDTVRGTEPGALEGTDGKGKFGGGSRAECTRRNLQPNFQTCTSDEKKSKMSGYVVSYQRLAWD